MAARKTPTKVGHPAWIPTDKDLDTVQRMIGEGASMRDICAKLKISPDTFYRKMKSVEEGMIASDGRNRLEQAVSTAKAVLGDRITNTILQVALDPSHRNHLKAATWYYERIIDKQQQEPSVIVIQSSSEKVDPKEIANALRDARRKDIPTVEKKDESQ